jgi:hypothetical protein
MNSQPIIDAPGIHGFFILGTQVLFASHMPMFTMSRHMYQVELRVSLPCEVIDAYRAAMTSAPTAWNYTNTANNEFALTQIKSGSLRSYAVDVYRDYAGDAPAGDPVATGVTLTVEEVVHFRHFQFDIDRPDHLTYLLFGRSGEAHLCHYVARDPDFHHIVTLGCAPDWISTEQLAAGVTISLADVASLPVPCADPLTAQCYPVLVEGRHDAPATLDLTGAHTVWFSTGNALNATDPCEKPSRS